MSAVQELTKSQAREIIESVGGTGTPPEYGFSFFTVGIDEYLDVLEDEYLTDYIRDGGSTFKLVVGAYGDGKTHMLYSVREIAWRHNYVVSYVQLSPEHSPFHKLEAVYRAIVQNIVYPMSPDELLSGYERGIESFIKVWYQRKYEEFENLGLSDEKIREELRDYADTIGGFESISFGNAVRRAFLATMNADDREFDTIMQWLKGEGYDRATHKKFEILQRIDKSTAFTMIRSLIQWIRFAEYAGMAVLMDEAEQIPSMSTKQRDALLTNLRELIDECSQASFKHCLIMYAVPDMSFMEGRTQIYEALRQRLSSSLYGVNPTGVQINLEHDGNPIDRLHKIGEKLGAIYEVAYDYSFEGQDLSSVLVSVSNQAVEEGYGPEGMHRNFVKKLIQTFHRVRRQDGPITPDHLAASSE